MENRLVERFLEYVKVDTQSDANSESQPSTSKQLNLAELVKAELIALELKDVLLDDNGYLTASLTANVEGQHDAERDQQKCLLLQQPPHDAQICDRGLYKVNLPPVP